MVPLGALGFRWVPSFGFLWVPWGSFGFLLGSFWVLGFLWEALVPLAFYVVNGVVNVVVHDVVNFVVNVGVSGCC